MLFHVRIAITILRLSACVVLIALRACRLSEAMGVFIPTLSKKKYFTIFVNESVDIFLYFCAVVFEEL